MLTSISAISQRASTPLVISLTGANAASVQLHDVDGLGPVKAKVNTTQFGSVDGELYNGSALGNRNIVLTFGLNPNWSGGQSMADLRAELYNYFMTKLWVRLTFASDHMPSVQIEGYVESFNPNMFSKDPEIQVSIICPKPNFVAIAPTVVGDTVKTAPGTPLVINYEGTEPTGFLLTLASVVPFNGNLTVKNVTVDVQLGTLTEQFTVTTPATVTATRKFTASTVKGAKYVRLMTGAVVNNNMLASFVSGMSWPQLVPGENTFIVTGVPSGTPMPDSPWSMSYVAEYGGI